MKVFDLYETSEVQIKDPSLKCAINLDEKLMVKSHGRHTGKFEKTKVNILERFIGYLGVPGHRGRKHRIITCWASGKYTKNAQILLDALKIIEGKTKTNPIQILIQAIENSAPCDEITTIEYGGARYPQAVDISPLRRISLALRNLVHGGYDKAFNKKSTR